MAEQSSEIVVTHNMAERQYEAELEGEIGVLTYERKGERILYTHTLVPPPIEGRGVGNALAHAALEDALREGLTVVPLCSFMEVYVRRHPEYQGLLG